MARVKASNDIFDMRNVYIQIMMVDACHHTRIVEQGDSTHTHTHKLKCTTNEHIARDPKKARINVLCAHNKIGRFDSMNSYINE